ncbi:class I SAM-dependent methyltransferase [Nocardioides sp. TRM66260-LWL]|uniref:class I SAM-dependent DNA methyltransferase n=1 Tax=Nocardioides sp. TRM66260-LWL TaxID=2874478 RepID=UPI001CC46584|nr:class I SAM-dependent methyltransferase [Nocardioides sp. TRM66260-LWL]MBZ5736069.1 class I SAM-dependent methyltransferase [Nocardioides sp. TRM66260-LWL]
MQSRSAVEAQSYDQEAALAGWDSPHRARRLVERFITPGTRVLDLGIGTGLAVDGYAEKGASVIGIDQDPAMLEAASAVAGEQGEMRLGNINERLPINDLEGRVDVAQAVGVLEFTEDLEGVLAQVCEALTPGGKFVFTVELAGTGEKHTLNFPEGVTVHRHTSAEVLDLLDRAGLRVLQDQEYAGYQRGGQPVPYGLYLAEKLERAPATLFEHKSIST